MTDIQSLPPCDFKWVLRVIDTHIHECTGVNDHESEHICKCGAHISLEPQKE